MMALTLSTASSNYLFSKEDLDKYPLSLLNSLMDMEAPRGLSPSTSTGVVLDVDKVELPMSKFPNFRKEEVVSLIYGVYKHGYLPSDTMEALITRLTPTFQPSTYSQVQLSDCTCAVECHKELHTELSCLLDYFNLPGSVTSWLPALKTLSLSQSPLISFTYTCYALERAEAAAKCMLSYKPHGHGHWPWHARTRDPLHVHTAVFIVHWTKLNFNTPPLAGMTVYVVPHPPELLTSTILPDDKSAGDLGSFNKHSGWLTTTYGYALPEGEDTGMPLDISNSVYDIIKRGHAVGGDEELGSHLLVALRALKPATLRVAHGVVVDDDRRSKKVHVWLLQWYG